MRRKYLIPVFVLPVLLVLLLPSPGQTENSDTSPRFIATYFLTNIRCPSCLSIERLTAETIQAEFAEELGAGLLEWRTINIDGEGNYHFVKDYQLYTKSVIISENVNEKEIRWKNLPKVWELLGNEKKFRKYLKDEIIIFMAAQ
jgi:hypothetical protein